MSNILMLDKYTPKNSEDLKGNDVNIKWIKKWLNTFKNNDNTFKNFKNGLLICGDSGVGKTLTAQILLKEENFDIIEFNASELRSAKIIREKFKSLINGSNILKMVNNTNKIGILMDEIDSNSIDKGCLKEIISYIENDETYILNDIKKKKIKETHINKYPIICICNSLSSTIKILNKACVTIDFESPNDKIILEIINKICENESINLDSKSKKLLVSHCQNDYRRIIYILDNIVSYFKKKKITYEDINTVINTFAQKDLDIGLYDSLNKINNNKLDINKILYIYNIDKTFIPLLVHENFNRNLEYNKIETSKNKINRMLNYYDDVIEGMSIESSVHENNNWELTDYVGIFSCVSANHQLNNNIMNSKTVKYTDIDSSPVYSKLNYKFYNLKLINAICKKIDIKPTNFQDFTFNLYKLFMFNKTFSNKDCKEFINYLKDKKISFVEFDKTIKLSYLYEQYKNIYTAKKKKELEIIFRNGVN